MIMRRLIFIFLMTVIAVSCGDDYKSSIPDVRFDFSCSLVQAEYSKLTTPGQFIKKTKNVHGIPVYLCEACGNPIPEARRKIFPGVTLCVECQAYQERQRKHYA